MPNRSSKPKKKRSDPPDINEIAAGIVEQATAVPASQTSPLHPAEDGKDPAAVALGRRGGLKGGPARAKKLSAKKRAEIARGAARARWKGKRKRRTKV